MIEGTITDAIGRGSAPAIAVFVYGHQAYGYAAETLALSLRDTSPGVPVHLWAGGGLSIRTDLFDAVHELPSQAYADGPGKLKLNVYDLLPDGDWMYVDADMIALSDVRPVLERLRHFDFAMDVLGIGSHNDTIPYTPWATNETIRQINDLKEGAKYYGVQSSWMWIRKPSGKAAIIFEQAKSCSDIYMPEHLKEPWGTGIPDELCFSSAFSRLGFGPHSEAITFYGSDHSYKGLHEVAKNKVFACLYGDVGQHRLIRSSWMTAYDRHIRKLYQKHGLAMRMDVYSIMRNKYVNHVKNKVLRKAPHKQAQATA